LLVAAFTLPGPSLDVSAGLFQSPVPTPPPNDQVGGAILIAELPYTNNQDTSLATWAPDDPGSCTSNGSVWYEYTASADTGIEADTFGSDYDTVLSAYVYTDTHTMALVACNDDENGLQSRVRFRASPDTTYYFLIGFCCGSGQDGGGNLVFSVQETPGPAHDDFENAKVITALPFEDHEDTWNASLETGEPVPSCVYSHEDWGSTVWYTYTPEESGLLIARTDAWFSSALAVYTGGSLNDLSETDCRRYAGQLPLSVQAGTTYYFQAGGLYSSGGDLWFYLEVAPPPEARFNFSPGQPSVFDNIWFYNYSYDPAGVGFESVLWDFGDGITSTEWSASHRYEVDEDYTVDLTVTTYDGRTDLTTDYLQVRTHDVAITKFSVPNAAKAGQTRSIAVGLSNSRYPEQVEVQLYRSEPGSYNSFERVGSLTQQVPVRQANRTTDFKFSYTFTSDEAQIGKVTFKAVARLLEANDALSADNEAISQPVKVRP
jgi:PKD repeat protein